LCRSTVGPKTLLQVDGDLMAGVAASLLQAALELAPRIASRAEETETAREVSRDLLDQIKAAGFFRMFAPRSHGGLELDLPSSLPILEALGRADGSTGWIVMIAVEGTMLLTFLPRHRFDTVFAHTPDVISAGSFTLGGEAKAVENGFEVSGRWPFASGCLHAEWLLGHCVISVSGAPRMNSASGLPETRLAVVRRDQAQVVDTWRVLGLRGTGSNDFVVERLSVQSDDLIDPLFGQTSITGPLYQQLLPQFGLHIASVAIGIARHALDDTIALAKTLKRRLFALDAMIDSPVFQHDMGRADSSLRAARSVLQSCAESFWSSLCSGRELSPEQIAEPSATAVWAATTAASVVDFCYSAAGGTAVYEASPLQRHLRDIHTLTQHIGVSDGLLTRHGAALLGKNPVFGR